MKTRVNLLHGFTPEEPRQRGSMFVMSLGSYREFILAEPYARGHVLISRKIKTKNSLDFNLWLE